jgi:hypothetical protein
MMEVSEFIDYYEILEVSPNAHSGAIEWMFPYLVQRYHPDNRDTGDRLRFDIILEAHNTLRDPVKRAVGYSAQKPIRASAGASETPTFRTSCCRRLCEAPAERERSRHRRSRSWALVSLSAEHPQFHIWYLREKGWISRTENGMLAITVEGVDRAHSERLCTTISEKLLSDMAHAGWVEIGPDDFAQFIAQSKASAATRRSHWMA